MTYRCFLAVAVLAFHLSIFVNAQSPRYARVVSENANIRDLPSVTSIMRDEIPEGSVVKVLDEKLPWYVVRFGSRVGWMHGNTIEFMNLGSSAQPRELVTPTLPPSSSSERRNASPDYSAPARRSSDHGGYITGPRGGCYYISASGRKVYVDRSLCN